MAGRARGIQTVTLMDYEFQPANHIGFRLATCVVVPEAFPVDRLSHYGASEVRVRQFDGFKEEMYLDGVLGGAGLPPPDRTQVLFRPPPDGALYHRHENRWFDELVSHAAARDGVDAVLLPRFPSQRERYARIPGVRVAARAVDGLQVLTQSDVFIGAGGTMSREAALLGVRAYTTFTGQLPALDRMLMRDGRLHDLRGRDAESVDWSPRDRAGSEAFRASIRARGPRLRHWFADIVEEVARGRPGTPRRR
jgi:predicted glycosyltransferase